MSPTTSTLFFIPKWMLLSLTFLPLLIFTSTLSICIPIVQRRGNTVWNGAFTLHANVFRNDISAYGIDSPEHYAFAVGFTLLSLVLSILMYCRYVLYKHYLLTSKRTTTCSCCGPCFNASVLAIGLLHAPPLITMGWTDGRHDQLIHFPAAMIGLGILHLYCTLQIFCSASVVRRAVLSRHQQIYFIVEILLLTTIAVGVPISILKWLLEGDSRFEWLAVCLLLTSTLPTFMNFWFMSNDLCRRRQRNDDNDDDRQEALLNDLGIML